MVVTETQTENRPAPEVSTGRIRVLIIEDNPADARLIQIMLSESGAGVFQVERADRLEEGMRRLEREGFDIVLCDLSLPDSHGFETFARLYARAPEVPIIVLSGLNDTTMAVTAVHEGAQDFLIKGQVDGQLLARAIRYAIERKRMAQQLHSYAAELREKNAQLQADFNMAREIQQIFLPNQYPTFPHSVAPEQSVLRFSHRYISAEAVGGDFFDIFPITDSAAGIFVCDVMGHGMRAALITAIMRGLIEELMPVAADAGKFLNEINRSLRAILKRTREPFLATAFYAVADAGSHEIRFSNAGHPSPMLLRRDAKAVEPLKQYDPRHGPALGLFERSTYPTSRCPFHPGNMLFLYTDGIYEAASPDGEEFGQDRLLRTIRQHIDLPAEQLFDRLLQEVQDFSGGQGFSDDVCLVGVDTQK